MKSSPIALTGDGQEPVAAKPPIRAWWKVAAIFAFVTLLYLRGVEYPFINYDDPQYVFQNEHVLGGLTSENAIWAFTTNWEANWHPVTWLSLQLDATLFGPQPAGFRIVNILLHAANTAILFAVLTAMTGATGRSMAAAMLFAAHPLRVESVIWVTERKDVLSTFFWLLTMAAYVRYLRRPGLGAYLPVVASLALGLMTKPMLVTLPCVLLLLDYWPLKRLGNRAETRWAIVEKLPLAAVAAISVAITIAAQSHGGSVKDLEHYPFTDRLANAVVSYVVYLRQFLAPADLALLYPYAHRSLLSGQVLASAVVLLLITVACFRWGRSLPYLPVGWLWFVGALVPVIGLVQVGFQAHADRYTYVPNIGLLVLMVWLTADALALWDVPATWRQRLAAGVVAVYAFLTWHEIDNWKDNVALWSHALESTSPENYVAQENLGVALAEADRPEEAIPHLAAGIEHNPNKVSVAFTWLASCQMKLGRSEDAIETFTTAVNRSPENNVAEPLGKLLAQVGRDKEALPYLMQTANDPAEVYLTLGKGLLGCAQYGRAADRFGQAASAAPERAESFALQGMALTFEGRPVVAVRPLGEAVRLNPRDGRSMTLLGLALAQQGDMSAAEARCREAVAIDGSAPAYGNLGMVLTAMGQAEEARRAYATALQRDFGWAEKCLRFAWEASVRKPGQIGVFLPRCQALQACEASGYRDPRVLLALAAVEAGDQRFAAALELIQRARTQAEKDGNRRLVPLLEEFAQSYRDNKPLLHRELP